MAITSGRVDFTDANDKEAELTETGDGTRVSKISAHMAVFPIMDLLYSKLCVLGYGYGGTNASPLELAQSTPPTGTKKKFQFSPVLPLHFACDLSVIVGPTSAGARDGRKTAVTSSFCAASLAYSRYVKPQY